ncbi:ribosome hibernation-promoting factor, HPF/YfiA family [Parashewanella tropica]|uniref:ribosome hibernation-promoting factor, HPF/YfiA family n=1 Tax=Parashewanella tropica TaxID=2547970 RepID=UPI001059F765|nr:ribosome-associated translation inhibitor RaiA [Parashewanella tropica]
MQIRINGQQNGQQLDVTESLKEYVSGKMAKLERHFEQINNVRVVLNVRKSNQTAEASLILNGKEAYAKSQHDDMYTAIDLLMAKLDRQVIKHKEKLIKH